MAGLFDSLNYSEKLQQAGVPAEQAAVHAKVLTEILSESVDFPRDLLHLEAKLNQKVESMQLKMLAEIEKVRSDTTLLKYMVGICISLQVTVFFKLFFG